MVRPACASIPALLLVACTSAFGHIIAHGFLSPQEGRMSANAWREQVLSSFRAKRDAFQTGALRAGRGLRDALRKRRQPKASPPGRGRVKGEPRRRPVPTTPPALPADMKVQIYKWLTLLKYLSEANLRTHGESSSFPPAKVPGFLDATEAILVEMQDVTYPYILEAYLKEKRYTFAQKLADPNNRDKVLGQYSWFGTEGEVIQESYTPRPDFLQRLERMLRRVGCWGVPYLVGSRGMYSGGDRKTIGKLISSMSRDSASADEREFLLDMLSDPSEEVRSYAMKKLAGSLKAQQRKLITEAMSSDNPQVRDFALSWLRCIAAGQRVSSHALQGLLGLLSDPSAQARADAKRLLDATLTIEDAALMREAKESLAPEVRGYAAKWLIAHPEAMPKEEVLGLLADPSAQVRASVTKHLDSALTLEDAALMHKAKQSPVPQVREYATRWLKAHPELLPKDKLLDRMDKVDREEGFLTVRALASKKLTFGQRAELKKHVPLLLESLQHRDPQIRRAATVLLAQMGRNGMPAVPYLARNLAHAEPAVWKNARDTLTAITGEALGPSDFANLEQRQAAAKRWLEWWRGRGGK